MGQGGFGIVEEVIGEDGLRYARKTLVVPPNLEVDQVKPRFEREVKYQSAISHNHVVHIFHHDLTANPPWFTMPLAQCSLLDEMMIDRTFSGDPRLALFSILAGLEEIHRLGYCHRDLKPHNVLKFEGPDGGIIYALSDFGLMAVGEEASSTLTPSGVGGGTPAYQAPECAVNFKRATARSDIYSFGALLHDIFAVNPKRLPHEQLTAPGDIGPVIERCTKRNAHRRYKDVAQLREALFDALNNYRFVYQSGEEQKVVELLSRDNLLPTEDEWDEVFDFLDATPDTGQPTMNVFQALRREHIDQLSQDDPDLMAALGQMFSDHCRKRSFNFDYCDVLAGKAQLFYEHGDIGLKASMAIGMLVLGLDHNRWFVERVFLFMAGPAAADPVVQRMIVEMSVLQIDFNEQFWRMTHSISVSKEALHPALQALVTDEP
ncbi:serine/threonine protein kinase [Sphingomonas oligophenolica]|uniref:Serine/threonine protein kinase n=1 Tax=Sphingomonas oligophenolica TaxID=301154 RepID=A0A502CG55_9SPHN|nr:serine/threonine protein kinase [Sphingomonas oligophenolica]